MEKTKDYKQRAENAFHELKDILDTYTSNKPEMTFDEFSADGFYYIQIRLKEDSTFCTAVYLSVSFFQHITIYSLWVKAYEDPQEDYIEFVKDAYGIEIERPMKMRVVSLKNLDEVKEILIKHRDYATNNKG